MDRLFSFKRRMILAALSVLLLADLALAAFSWQSSTSLRTPMASLEAESHSLGLLNSDIERAEKIRHDLPATIADCNRFDASLLPASTGGSAVTDELDTLAKKSGVQIQSLGFRHKEVAGRNLTDVDLDATLIGDYASIVKFMNNVQRSQNFYIVESLNVQSEGQGNSPSGLRIGLHMKTYFRTTA